MKSNVNIRSKTREQQYRRSMVSYHPSPQCPIRKLRTIRTGTVHGDCCKLPCRYKSANATPRFVSATGRRAVNKKAEALHDVCPFSWFNLRKWMCIRIHSNKLHVLNVLLYFSRWLFVGQLDLELMWRDACERARHPFKMKAKWLTSCNSAQMRLWILRTCFSALISSPRPPLSTKFCYVLLSSSVSTLYSRKC